MKKTFIFDGIEGIAELNETPNKYGNMTCIIKWGDIETGVTFRSVEDFERFLTDEDGNLTQVIDEACHPTI